MAKEAGLYAWLNTGSLIDFSDEPAKRKEKLTELVDRFKDHPALAVWEVPDEVLWNLGYPKLSRLFYGPQWTQEQQDSILHGIICCHTENSPGHNRGI